MIDGAVSHRAVHIRASNVRASNEQGKNKEPQRNMLAYSPLWFSFFIVRSTRVPIRGANWDLCPAYMSFGTLLLPTIR